jgi:hypothetical protein
VGGILDAIEIIILFFEPENYFMKVLFLPTFGEVAFGLRQIFLCHNVCRVGINGVSG